MREVNIKTYSIKEKIFKINRWYSKLELPIENNLIIPFAHYVWLTSNLAFIKIPMGYVIELFGDGKEFLIPHIMPRIEQYRPNKFRVSFRTRINGKSKKIILYKWKDKSIISKEMAEAIREELWGKKQVVL